MDREFNILDEEFIEARDEEDELEIAWLFLKYANPAREDGERNVSWLYR